MFVLFRFSFICFCLSFPGKDYLSAFGKRPCARITRRSHHGINPILSLYQMSLQVGTNIHPNRPQIHPVGAPKSMNLGFQIGLGGLLEGSWGWVLGPSWPQDGPKLAPRTLHDRICKQKLRLLGAKLEPKIDQNLSQERSEMLSFF